MEEDRYKLRYLPVFYDDMEAVIAYITDVLKNPSAACDLLDEVEAAILKRSFYAESFEPYHSKHERKYPYYRIYVNHFVVYYVVIDDEGSDKIMEVRRFLYEKQDLRLKI